jgi:MFS family permease
MAGIGGLTLSVLLPTLLSQWFRTKELGLAMGIFNTGVPLGSVICFGLFGKIGTLWGWRTAILLTGIYALITAILLLSFYQLPSSQTLKNRKREDLGQSLKEMGAPIWWVGVSWLWFNAAFVSFTTFAPNFFLQKGYTIEQSGFLTGTPILGSLFFSPVMGYLVDRFRHREWLVAIGGVALSILILSFNFSSSFLLLVILMGIFSATIPAPIYSLPSRLLKPENLGLGFGVISTCSSIGLFMAPYLVGKVKDLTGSYAFSFVFISLFFLFTGVSIFFVHGRRNSSEQGVRGSELISRQKIRDSLPKKP